MELHFPLILDGATGTQLQKRGMTSGVCSEQWVLEHPATIQELQRDYIAAGSQIVYACTFGANRVKLEENGIFGQVRDYNMRLVALSKEAAAGKAWVAGDIAPTGKFLAPMGDMTFEELVEIYTEQAAALEEAGVDLFVIETMMTLPEARAAVLAVKSVSRKPVFVSFTCDEKGRTLTGTDVAAALLVMQGMGKTVYRCTPEEFAACVPELAAAGVAIYGGCCGTEAGHIQRLAACTRDADIQPPKPERPDLLPLATEKVPALLPADVSCGAVLPCDENLGDALEAAEESADPVTAIRIEGAEQLPVFAENQFAVTKPLCILTEDAAVLEQALRLYQGRAMYEGDLPEAVLAPLRGKYGLVY